MDIVIKAIGDLDHDPVKDIAIDTTASQIDGDGIEIFVGTMTVTGAIVQLTNGKIADTETLQTLITKKIQGMGSLGEMKDQKVPTRMVKCKHFQ